jgi:alkylation response protein AidB-like acyl-CoA dehydrogenase
MTDVEVPADYAFDLFTDEPTRSEPLYQAPVLPVLNGAVAAVPVGIARGALTAFKEYARTKVALPNPDPIRESAIVQADVARAEIALRSSELLLFSAMDDIWQTVKNGGTVNGEQRAHFGLGCVNAGLAAVQAVDLVTNLAGTAGILESYPFERCFRDVHAAAAHRAMHTSALIPCGQVLLGLEPQRLL